MGWPSYSSSYGNMRFVVWSLTRIKLLITQNNTKPINNINYEVCYFKARWKGWWNNIKNLYKLCRYLFGWRYRPVFWDMTNLKWINLENSWRNVYGTYISIERETKKCHRFFFNFGGNFHSQLINRVETCDLPPLVDQLWQK